VPLHLNPVPASHHGGRVFDRQREFDEKSRRYPIRAFTLNKKRRGYTWSVPVHLDQGSEGACVGFGWAHELAARPYKVTGIDNSAALQLYQEARRVDEWPGEDYDGTSVLAGAKVAAQHKKIHEYRWAFGEDDLALAVGYKGPAVIGVNWYENMFEPDRDGYLAPSGDLLGGHCVLVYGYDASGFYRIWNSWGPSWGQGGTAKVHREDMAYLLSLGGEACIPTRRTVGIWVRSIFNV
jgi:hypothetical protein